MRYRRAVEKLRILAEECDSQGAWPREEPLLREACVFGDLLDGDHQWRRKHRGAGRYPENELWEAVEGYLDLCDASNGFPP